MKFFVPSILALAAYASAQNATTNGTAPASNRTAYATGLLSALGAANLTTLASLATANAQALLPLLTSGGNFTIFAPTDAAFAAVPNATLSNASLVSSILDYHIYRGAYATSNLSSVNNTIARSLLNATGLVHLPGGVGQVAVLRAPSNQTVLNLPSNVTSVATARYQNLDIYVINQVLTIPGNLTATATAAGLTALTGALTQFAPQVVPVLSETRGITVFAPNNAAFTNAAGALASLAANVTQVQNVLLGHVLNGTVAYSSQITNGSTLVAASGETLTFISNSTGVFVRSANSTARIISVDNIISNGVVHVIDTILANPGSNPQAAASAASSAAGAASSAATQTATGAVGSASARPSGAASSNMKTGAGVGALAFIAALVL